MVESPTAKAPVPEPEITLLKVAVTPLAAAILLAPVANVIVLVTVFPSVLRSNVPPPIVTAPVDRFVPLAPPVATDKIPLLILVPPV